MYRQTILVSILLAATAAKAQTLDQILANADKSAGSDADHENWKLSGAGQFQHAAQSFELLSDDRGRFKCTISGPLSQAFGFDGSKAWVSGPMGFAHTVILQNRDENRMLVWTAAGIWARRSTPLQRTLETTAGGTIKIRLQPKDGIGSAEVILDPATSLPKSIAFENDTWTFDAYRAFGKRNFPTRITHESGSETDSVDIQAVKPAQTNRKTFALPPDPPGAVQFDETNQEPLEFKQIAGLLFVRPGVDSRDVGWFFVDTGADTLCIDPAIAKKLDMQVIGADSVPGAVAVSQYNFVRGKTLKLGPLTLPNPIFVELDLSGFSKLLGIPLAGVCGYEVISHGDLDVDPKSHTLRMLPSGKAVLPDGARWTPFRFDSSTPCLVCSFAGGNPGWFRLDTGSNSSVDFSSPTVERYHLMDGKKLTSSMTGGAGGNSQSFTGPIDWFQMGSRRFTNPQVGYQVTKSGAFATTYLSGNIGMAFMSKFHIVLDYANQRVAFIKE